MSVKSISIRIDEQMLDKLHIIANFEGRSANSQMLVLVRECIERYDEKYNMFDGNITDSINIKPRKK